MLLRRLLFSLLVMITLPTLALARPLRPWIAGSVGAATYSMGDVNDDIGNINAAIAGSGLRMDPIEHALNFGAAAGFDFGKGFSLGVGYDRLPASSDVGDWSGSIVYDFPGSFVRAFGRYAFQSTSKANGFLEGSLGRISAGGDVTVNVSGEGSVSGDVEGSGIGFEGAAGIELWTSPQFAFTGSLGFRHAVAKDVKVDGLAVYNNSGGEYTIDYSGVFARAGVRLSLAQ